MLKSEIEKAAGGQSLFEVLLAVAIITLIITSVVSLSTVSVRNASFSRDNETASQFAQELGEWLRQERDIDWLTFSSRASSGGTNWCFPSLSWAMSGTCGATTIPATIFRRQARLTLSDVSGDGINDKVEATVEVFWDDAAGTHVVRTITSLTDWRR